MKQWLVSEQDGVSFFFTSFSVPERDPIGHPLTPRPPCQSPIQNRVLNTNMNARKVINNKKCEGNPQCISSIWLYK